MSLQVVLLPSRGGKWLGHGCGVAGDRVTIARWEVVGSRTAVVSLVIE